MNISIASFSAIVTSVQDDATALWSGLTSGMESSASWLFGGSQATVAQHAQLGTHLLDRAAELSQRLVSLAEGIGTPAERAALQESAQRMNAYIDATRAAGTEAVAAAGATAATAARQAMVGATARAAGVLVDGYEYVGDLTGALTRNEWTKFGGTAAGMGASTAFGAAGAGIAAAAIAALASVVAVPAGIGTVVIFGAAAVGAYSGNNMGPTIFKGFNAIPDLVAEAFVSALAFTPRVDPLVIDLDRDGLELRAADGQVLFDHNADGIRTGTGWAASDDALLVWDRNGNGSIDSGRELFGVDTIKSNGQLATNGFDALRDIDSNGDGMFSSADAQFASVRLWRDLDQDGVTDAGELATLAASGIASISLTSILNGTLVNNNRIESTSVVTRTDGLTSTAGAIDLAENGFAREFTNNTVTGTVTITDDAQALPEMRGSGMVRDLREAMSLINPSTNVQDAQSTALVSALQSFAAGSTRDAQRGQLDPLVQAWGATSTHATSIETSTAMAPGGAETAVAKWARLNPEAYQRIETMERFNGSNFLERRVVAVGGGFEAQVLAQQLAFIDQAYIALRESVYGALVTQTRLRPYLDSIELVIDSTGVRFDAAPLAALLNSARNVNVGNGIKDLVELIRYAGPTLQATGYDGATTLSDWVQALSSSDPLWPELTAMDVFVSNTSTGSASGGSARADLYVGDGSANSFDASAGDDLIFGGGGNDVLSGGAGNDTLWGDAGTDTLNGGAGNDDLNGGVGDDNLQDSDGSDTIDGGDGDDSITDQSDGANVLRGGSGNDTVSFWLSSSNSIDGGAGNDQLLISNDQGGNYYSAVNTLAGGVGNDTIRTGAGTDTVVFNRGDGQDTWRDNAVVGYSGGVRYDAGHDTLRFGAGIVADDLLISQSGNDLLVHVADPVNASASDQVKIEGWFASDAQTIEQFSFADGSSLSKQQVHTLSQIIRGTAGNDTLSGSLLNNTIMGLAGNDTITDGGGSDTIDGGDGDDSITDQSDGANVLRGGSGNDTVSFWLSSSNSIDGGAGNDMLLISNDQGGNYYSAVNTLAGGVGNDTIRTGAGTDTVAFNRGDGQDTWRDNAVVGYSGGVRYDAGHDTLRFGAGIVADDLLISQSGNDLLVHVADPANASASDQVKIEGWFASDAQTIEQFSFADGSSLSKQQIHALSQVLRGTAGNDTLAGGSGDGTILGLTGNDTITDIGGNDSIDAGEGNDTITDRSGNDRIIAGEGNDIVEDEGGSDTIDGGDGDDTITDSSGNDTIDGGDGNDSITDSGTGSNVLRGGAGQDTITLSPSSSNIIDGGSGDDAIKVNLADYGYQVSTSAHINTFVGGTGNDSFNVFGSTDTYFFNRGDGQDRINDYSGYSSNAGVDKLVFGEGITQADLIVNRANNHLMIRLNDSSDQIEIQGWFLNAAPD